MNDIVIALALFAYGAWAPS